MSEPTTEAGRAIDDDDGHHVSTCHVQDRTPGPYECTCGLTSHVVAIEREAAREALERAWEEVEALPIFSVATGDYVDRTSALDTIDAIMPKEEKP